MTTSPRRSKTARVLFSVFVAFAALASAEGALAVLGLPRATTDATGYEDTLSARTPLDLAIYAPDPVVLWRLKPSTVLIAPDRGYFEMRTNAAGLRGAELPPPERAPGELRVLCLGDSVTNGMHLGERQTYPARLEEELRGKFPERRVRVVNGGVPGHSFVQGRRLFDELRALHFDAVVCWYGANDAKPALRVPDREIRMPSVASIRFSETLRASRIYRAIELAASDAPSDARRATPAETADNAEHVRRAMAEDGGAALLVRGPNRLADKEAQLARVIEAARAANADAVEGSSVCLSMYVCGAPESERVARSDGTLLVLESDADPRTRLPVARLVARRDEVRAWRTFYEQHAAALGADAIDGAKLFGELAPSAALADNVHLTDAGAREVAKHLADAIAGALKQGR